jgi:glyoxylase-like metal-dependent hydrolase (beta-lactamase superfamily II)
MHLRQLAPEVWVGISAAWQTTHTICGRGGALVIDGPVLPGEVAALATHARPDVLIATHADWDHLLAPLAFPNADRRAGRATIARLGGDHDQIAEELAAWDRAHGGRPRGLPDWRLATQLDAPAVCGSPVGPLQIFPTSGHTHDGIAVFLSGPEILIAGDYLSPCEIPSLGPGAACADYLASLGRLEYMMHQARCVVPGHGWPIDAVRARTVLAEDRRYLEALADGAAPPLPRHAAAAPQQAQHRANLIVARGA